MVIISGGPGLQTVLSVATHPSCCPARRVGEEKYDMCTCTFLLCSEVLWVFLGVSVCVSMRCVCVCMSVPCECAMCACAIVCECAICVCVSVPCACQSCVSVPYVSECAV